MGTLADRMKARREMYEDAGVAKKIDRESALKAGRALGWLTNGKNKNVQKEFNKGANNR